MVTLLLLVGAFFVGKYFGLREGRSVCEKVIKEIEKQQRL